MKTFPHALRSKKFVRRFVFFAIAAAIVGAPLFAGVSAQLQGDAAPVRTAGLRAGAEPSPRRIKSAAFDQTLRPKYENPLLLAGMRPEVNLSSSAGAATPDLGRSTLDERLGEERTAALKKLSAKRRGGAPFAIQEIEIIDAFEAGLLVEIIEADIVISRALYDVYVAGKQPTEEQGDLLVRYRAFINEHASDLIARNAQLNADFPEAKGTSAPDGSRDWELYWDPELFHH